MAKKPTTISVGDNSIKILRINDHDYICLTDMVKNYGGDEAIYSWLRNRNTVEFIGIWETINNPNFKGGEFDTFRKQAGLNSFHLTPRKWIEATDAVGIVSKAGRYNGGTFAHKDIAFEFGSYLSPEFKLMIIKEFQRLKEIEQKVEQWDYRRFLTKVNYRLQTKAVQDVLLPLTNLSKNKHGILYADEAELLNIVLFGKTSKEWRENNPQLAQKGNIRDYATIDQLTVLSNLESTNSMFIAHGVEKENRFKLLREEAKRQLIALISAHIRLLPKDATQKISKILPKIKQLK